VQISYTLAGLSDRIFAHLIDLVIIGSTTALLFAILVTTGLLQSSPYLIILAFIPYFFYHLTFEITMHGQSIGKKTMNIKVVKLDGTEATISGYLLRWLIRPIDIVFYGGIAILFIIVGGKGQRLGDLAAGTTVIKLKKSQFLKEHTFNIIDDSYEPVFENADQLPGEYADLINKAIKAKLEMLDDKPVTLLAKKIKDRLKINTNMPDLKFLHTILKDYNHLMGKMAE